MALYRRIARAYITYRGITHRAYPDNVATMTERAYRGIARAYRHNVAYHDTMAAPACNEWANADTDVCRDGTNACAVTCALHLDAADTYRGMLADLTRERAQR